jgi:hypothetical protein
VLRAFYILHVRNLCRGADEQLSPEHALNTENGTHTFVSFAYTKRTGVYMTMYYSTKILGVHMKHDIWSGYDKMWTDRRKRHH